MGGCGGVDQVEFAWAGVLSGMASGSGREAISDF